ncbi:MAG: V-type ATP synthase subunit C [Actinomycetota bacterium]|nr:V-type ATP synthase subunit C [Actinomycetota bacterium]
MRLKAFIDPIKYGVATGRIKVLENKLFSRHRVERLVEADDFSDQLRILAETDYGGFFENVRTIDDIEEALHKYLAKVYDFLDELTRERNIISFFRLRYDFHNLKVILKTKYKQETREHIWSHLGLLDVPRARDLIEQGMVDELPEVYRQAVKEAMHRFEEERDSQQIDIVLDGELYKLLHGLAVSQRNDFLQDLVKIFIDLGNIKTFLRAKNLGRKKDFISQALFDNGSIDREIFIALYEEPLDSLLERLKNTPHAELLRAVFREEKKVDLSTFDKLVDNFVLNHAKKAKYVPVGLEPIVGYILAKESEVNMVRVILTGRLNNVPRDKIRERIRDLYV